MTYFGDKDKYEKWLRQQEDILALRISSRHLVKNNTVNILALLICGIIILYWFFPLTLDIINEKIIERYELLPIADFVITSIHGVGYQP